jgi:hypothetical protein
VSALDDLIQAAREAGTRLAAEAADGARAEVRRDADREISEIREAATREADEQRTRLTGEIEELQRRLEEMREAGEQQIAEFQRQLNESQQRIESAGHEADALRQQVEAERERGDAARTAAESARTEAEAARAETESARAEADAATAHAKLATRDLDAARQELETTRADVEATLEDIERARRDSDRARAELRQLSDTLRRTSERTTQSARLPDAVRSLDQAVTFGEVLERLAQSAGREAGRAVVFLVKGERLRDWRTVGFHLASDQARLDMALSDSGPMAETVRLGEGVRLGGEHPLPDFAQTGEARDGAAWPVTVGGSVVAVLYADSPLADTPDEIYWPGFLEVLARHAGRVLEGLTVRQAAGLMTGQSGVRSSSLGQSSGSLQ